MIEGLKPYAEYKESGLSWLSKIPSNWQTVRNGSLFSQRNETNYPQLPILEVSLRTGVRVRNFESSNRKQLMSDFSKYKRAVSGDVSRGIVKDRNRLYWDQFKQMRSLAPPPNEQAAIVLFLDHANRKIDGFIRAKRKLIGLLNEQKQAIIHRAVTRGLNPDVPLKPSGIHWLGDIPQHWEVLRLGRVIKLITGFPFPSDGFTQKGSAMRLLRGINVTPSGLRWDATVRWERTQSDGLDAFFLQVGDIVLGMDRPIIAAGVRAASVQAEDIPAMLLQRVARLRPEERITGPFMLLLLQERLFAEYIAPIFTGISVPHLSPEQIKGFKVMLPPVNEQEEIVAFIAKETTAITTAIARTEREIALMQEYRTRLTADIVTGKLDVREAGAKLSDVREIRKTDDEVSVNDDCDENVNDSN